MTNEIIEKALNKKGQFATIAYCRQCKTLKSCNDIILKSTRAKNIRIGAGYDNLKSTIEGRENGTLPAENAGLNGMQWIKYPVLLQGKSSQYIRLETSKNTIFETAYYKNGNLVDKKDIENLLFSSEKKSSGEIPTVLNIKVDNIVGIN